MNYPNIRKLFLRIFIGFLMLTAIVGIVSVLSGDFGELQVKILATCLTISAASICSMACAAFMEKRRPKALGFAGITLSLAAATLTIIGLWLEIDSEEYWKTTITFTIVAVAFAHAFLLLLPDLDGRFKWIQVAASVCIGILALQIVVAVWGEINDETYYRLLAVVAIVVGLETLVIPILMKFRQMTGRQRDKLVLESIEGGLYADASGKRYRLTEISDQQ